MGSRYYSAILFITASLLLWVSNLRAQGDLNIKNFKHLYDPNAEISLTHKQITLDDRVQLYLKLTIRHNRTKIEDLITTYTFLDRYSGTLEMEKDTIRLGAFWINNIANQHFFNFEIHNPDKNRILVLRIYNQATENEFYYSFDVDPEAKILNSGIGIMLPDQNIPYFRNYLRINEYFRIYNFKTQVPRHYIFRYTDNFPVAIPPFLSSVEAPGKDLEIDSVFDVARGDKLILHKRGLYFVQADTTGINGLAFRTENQYYPRETTYNDLIEALTYFSTNSEMSRFQSAGDKKKAFEEYWLEVAGTAERAKRVIRDYYLRIRQANEFFTNYKQGWKTDKGMIYVVFGPPDVVHKSGKKEEWIYERNAQLPRISFEFQKIESLFTRDHFVLVRKRSYQQIWYKTVDLWRKGQMDI